jgi:tartrate dehydratase alpha subunit/fumarate hydratase class I-like protein
MPTKKKSPDTAHKIAVELRPEVYERVKRAAAADDRTVVKYVARFIAQNLDVIDPEGAPDA